MYDYLNNFLLNPTIFIIIFLIIVAYFILFYSLGNNSTTTNNSSGFFSNNTDETSGSGFGQGFFGIFIIIIIIILLIINAFEYFFSISITAYLSNLFTNNASVNVVVEQPTTQPTNTTPVRPLMRYKQEVFNIPGNYYNYTNAKALCQAYGSRLATYKEIENSYNKGAEWCNYGWSDGQMALFPTQKATFDNLQKIEGHEHDCGRQGINGGYIANPNVRFGVNCFGYKPKKTEEERELMDSTTPYPQTIQDTVFQKRVDFWKTRIDDILVSPFNYDTWSKHF
jgi:flagellar basal body-associated protein FliL